MGWFLNWTEFSCVRFLNWCLPIKISIKLYHNVWKQMKLTKVGFFVCVITNPCWINVRYIRDINCSAQLITRKRINEIDVSVYWGEVLTSGCGFSRSVLWASYACEGHGGVPRPRNGVPQATQALEVAERAPSSISASLLVEGDATCHPSRSKASNNARAYFWAEKQHRGFCTGGGHLQAVGGTRFQAKWKNSR